MDDPRGVDDLRRRWLDAIREAPDEAALEAARVAALGKKGEVSLAMRELGRMSPEERQNAPQQRGVRDDGEAVGDAFAAVDDDGFSHLCRESKLLNERPPLHVAGDGVVEVVQAALADGDDPRVPQKLPQVVGEIGGGLVVARVDAGRAGDVVEPPGQRQPGGGVGGRGADRHAVRHADLPCPLQDARNVVGELRERQVAVRVDHARMLPDLPPTRPPGRRRRGRGAAS